MPNKELKLTKPSVLELRSLTPVFDGLRRGERMQRKAARLTWVVATVVCTALATVLTWQGETRTWRVDLCCPGGVPLDPYYLAVFSWTPLAGLAWFGAGAVLLARRVRYRGFWYMAPQILVLTMMAIRLAAAGLERGFPDPLSLGPGTMTPVRWTFVVLGGLSYMASLIAAGACMAAAVSHRPVLDEPSSGTVGEEPSRRTRG